MARSLNLHGRVTLATQEEDELDRDFFEVIARDARDAQVRACTCTCTCMKQESECGCNVLGYG